MRVPPDHTFGVLIAPDEYGAGDLMHGRVPGSYLRGKDRERGLLAAVRQQLKKANYHNFNDLQAAFNHYDKVRIYSSMFHLTQNFCSDVTRKHHLLCVSISGIHVACVCMA